jgi:hypothetical protein
MLLEIEFMRILKFAIVAAFLSAGSHSVFAQTTATPPAGSAPAAAPAKKASVCKGLDEAACQPPTCSWVAPGKTKAGKERKGYCRKAAKPKAKKSAAAPATPAAPAAPR